MKVIHCINSFSSLSGGVGFALKAMLEILPAKNHIVLTLKDEGEIFDVSNDVNIFKRSGPFALSYSIEFEKFLENIIKQESNVVIHLHGLWSGMSFSVYKLKRRYRNVKLIISSHGMLSKIALNRRKYLKLLMGFFIEKPLLNEACIIHSLNNAEKKSIYYFLKSDKTIVIPHPHNFNLSGRDIKRIWSEKPEVKKLIYIGRFHETKGLVELINAFKELKKNSIKLNFKTELIGFGNEHIRLKLEKIIETEGLNIQIKPAVFGKDKYHKMLNSHGIILPSRTEGLPMSLIEASSLSLPLFITEECNITWVKNGYNGYQYQFGKENLKKLLLKFNNLSCQELSCLGANNYEDAKNMCDSQIIKEKWIKLYTNE